MLQSVVLGTTRWRQSARFGQSDLWARIEERRRFCVLPLKLELSKDRIILSWPQEGHCGGRTAAFGPPWSMENRGNFCAPGFWAPRRIYEDRQYNPLHWRELVISVRIGDYLRSRHRY